MADDPHAAAHRVRAITITPQGGPAFLIVELEITCAVCGGFEARIAGHHLGALVEALAQIVAEHPGLTGERSGEVSRLEWQARVPGDLSKGEMN